MKLYTQIFLTLICLHAHFTHAFQATRSANMDIPARSIQQPLLDSDSDSAAFYPSFYQHLHSFTSTSSLSERAQAEQEETSFPFMSLPNSEQSCSSSSSSSATTGKYVAMHPIATESVGSHSTATTSAQFTSSSTTIPLYECQNLPTPTKLILQSNSGKIFARLQDGFNRQYGLDIGIEEQQLKNLSTKSCKKTIQEILTKALKGSVADDWILEVDNAHNFLILFGERTRVDFTLYYRFISPNHFKQRVVNQQSHHDIVDIRYEPTTKKIVASCENKIIKVFETNPLKLVYAFKSRTNSTYVNAPAITTSRNFIIVGSASQLEIYKETEDGKSIQHVASYQLLYKDFENRCLQEPNIISLDSSTKPNRNSLVGTLAINKDCYFFALQIPHLIDNKFNQSEPTEIIRLPTTIKPEAYTIINRLDGSFLVPCNNGAAQLRFRNEKRSSDWDRENPYYQNVIEKRTIPSQVLFDIVTLIFKNAKQEPDDYLIFRKTPYLSNNYEDVDTYIAPHINTFLNKDITKIICEYLKHRICMPIYECFYHDKRVPLISLKRNRYAGLFNGNLVIFNITNLINIKTDPAIAKSLRTPIPF